MFIALLLMIYYSLSAEGSSLGTDQRIRYTPNSSLLSGSALDPFQSGAADEEQVDVCGNGIVVGSHYIRYASRYM